MVKQEIAIKNSIKEFNKRIMELEKKKKTEENKLDGLYIKLEDKVMKIEKINAEINKYKHQIDIEKNSLGELYDKYFRLRNPKDFKYYNDFPSMDVLKFYCKNNAKKILHPLHDFGIFRITDLIKIIELYNKYENKNIKVILEDLSNENDLNDNHSNYYINIFANDLNKVFENYEGTQSLLSFKVDEKLANILISMCIHKKSSRNIDNKNNDLTNEKISDIFVMLQKEKVFNKNNEISKQKIIRR